MSSFRLVNNHHPALILCCNIIPDELVIQEVNDVNDPPVIFLKGMIHV